jgi:hypothetical protein
VIARGDRKLEDLGKVAALVDTGSPLAIGRKGKYRGSPFELTGRAQFSHQAGGSWDEWYASFPKDRWGWLGEAQGRYYLTFESPLAASSKLPELKSIVVGASFMIPGQGVFVADEIGAAQAHSAEGEIPYRLVPGETLEYVDLSGRGGRFATLDFSDTPPHLYLGEQVTLDALGIPHVPADEPQPRHVGSLQINCPQCGGALDLMAPDVTERVACPYCHALLDCTQGKLQYLETLKPSRWKQSIPLGTIGTLDGITYTVIGFLVRHVTIDGEEYFWSEYLLYGTGIGFRWLVESDGHWSLVASVPGGEIKTEGRAAIHRHRLYRLFQQAPATVDFVAGEFYWKVSVGESVSDSDFVRPPYILSREISFPDKRPDGDSQPGNRGEVNWSAGVYLTPAEIAQAFKLKDLPQPLGVAPNQPFPYKNVYRSWAILAALTLLSWLLLDLFLPAHQVLEKSYTLDPPTAPETTRTVFEHELPFRGHRSVQVTVSAPVDNSWLYVDGDLFNEESDLVQPFSVPVEYYHGTDSDGSWSEGSRTESDYVSARPSGNYTLRMEFSWQDASPAFPWTNSQAATAFANPRSPAMPMTVTVRIEETAPRFLYFAAALLLISILPVGVAVRHYLFEMRRWEDSEFNPYPSFGGDDN